MGKKYYRLSGSIQIPLILMLFIILSQTPGRTEALPSDQTPGDDVSSSAQPKEMSESFTGTVSEIINAGRYMYVQIETGSKKIWVAVPTFDGKPGDKVVVPPGVPVAGFQSKKLNRSFEMVYFVGGIRRTGEKETVPAPMPDN